MEVKINGCVEVPDGVTDRQFAAEFIEFIESKGYYFGGGINEYKEEKSPWYVPPKEEWIRQYGTNKQILGYEKKVAKQLAEDGLTEKQIEAALREM